MWPAFAVLLLVVSLFFAPGLFHGNVPVFRDLLVLVVPLRRYAALAVRSGNVPLWNPHLFFGAPFLANYQSAVLYPPSVILYVVPFPESLSLFLAFHLLVAGWGMTLYLRCAHGLEPLAALLGGVVFSFGGFFISLIPLTNQLEVAAWTPWVLLAARTFASTGEIRCFAALTLLFTMQGLGGAPESMTLTAILVGVDCYPLWRRIPGLIGALALALGLCAAQLLPTLEYALETNRVVGLPYASVVSESLRPGSLLQFVVPHVFTGGAPGFVPEGGVPLFWSVYLGTAPLAFALVGLLREPLSRWSFLLAVGFALALGGNTPIFPVLYDIAPRAIGLFRYPGKCFLLAQTALAVLAARGLTHTAEQRSVRLALAILGAISTLSACFAAWALFAPQLFLTTLGYAAKGLASSTYDVLASPPRWSAIRSTALSVAALAILWFLARRRTDSRGLAASLIALTLVDLLPVHVPTLVFTNWNTLAASVDVERLGLENGDRIFHYCARAGCVGADASGFGAWNGTLQPLERVETQAQKLWAALVPDVPIVYGLGAVAGVDGWSTRDHEEFYRLLALLPRGEGVHLLAALSVNQLIGQSAFDDPALQLLSRLDDRAYWRYCVSDAAPHTYLAERIFFAPDVRSALERVARADFRPGRDAVVSGAGAATSTVRLAGKIETAEFGAGFMRTRVSLPAPGFLVVSESWYPGWSASIDGSPTDIVRTNGILRGVYVSAGRHDVEMHYFPTSFRIGCGISLAVAVSFAGVVALGLRHRRRQT